MNLENLKDYQILSDRFLFQFEEISASFPNYCNKDLIIHRKI